MPTREDGIPKSSFEVGRKNLCDCNSLGGYMVSASFGGNGDIVLSYYPHYYRLRCGKKRHITLKFEESNKRGFVIYSFDDTSCVRDSFVDALVGKMNPSIYHYIKGAFHTHVNHLPNEDALLQAYAKCEKLTLANEENEIIKFYLDQYKDKFDGFLLYAHVEYESSIRQISGFINVNRGINALGSIIDKGNSIKGELDYYNYLLKKAREQCAVSKEFGKCVSAVVDDICKLLNEVNNSYNLCTAGLGVKYGRWGIFFGVLGIIVSFIGVWQSVISEPDPLPVNNHTDSTMNSLRNTVDRMHESMQDSINILNHKLDSINAKMTNKNK